MLDQPRIIAPLKCRGLVVRMRDIVGSVGCLDKAEMLRAVCGVVFGNTLLC